MELLGHDTGKAERFLELLNDINIYASPEKVRVFTQLRLIGANYCVAGPANATDRHSSSTALG